MPWPRWLPLVSLGILVFVSVAIDAYRVSFFADDFHFLDIGKRATLGDLLSGSLGMWPWYRPLSRELYFALVARCDPFSLLAAHTISIAVLAGVVSLLWRIGSRLSSSSAAVVGIVLFLGNGTTKFLTGWASGFQDLAALFLILLAVDSYQVGRQRLALACTFLAPFAKETGFVILPLLIAYRLSVQGTLPRPGWVLRYSGAAMIAAALHVAARMTWPAHGSLRPAIEPERLPVILWGAVRTFVSPAPMTSPGRDALAWTLIGTIVVVVLLGWARSRDRGIPVAADPPRSRGRVFLVAATALGALPVITAHLLTLTFAHSYHLFPATPWAALLLGALVVRLPRGLWSIGVPLLLAWNIWGSSFVELDATKREHWGFHGWNWHQAIRASAQSRSLAADVRRELATHSESLIVLYETVPDGALFQTEDGPATRIALGDPTVRAFRLNEPPSGLRDDRLAILTFDAELLGLRSVRWTHSEVLLRAMKAVIGGRGDVANALLAFKASSDPARYDRAYVRSAAALVAAGPERYLEGLHATGLTDSNGAEPHVLSAAVTAVDRGLGAAMERAMSVPLSADAHSALAESLLARDVLPAAGVEYRIAVSLDPQRFEDRYRMARVMLALGGAEEAVDEFRILAEDAHSGVVGDRARGWLARWAE